MTSFFSSIGVIEFYRIDSAIPFTDEDEEVSDCFEVYIYTHTHIYLYGQALSHTNYCHLSSIYI